MTAVATPPDGAPAPADEPVPALGLPQIAVNLLPDEVRARRRVRHLRRRMVFVLAALVALVTLGYGLAWQQTQAARDELSSEQTRTAQLNQSLLSFAPLLRAQESTRSIAADLAGAMAGDLQWSRLISALHIAAPAGLQVTLVDGQLQPAAPDTVATGSAEVIGGVTITGTAANYRLVADYVQTLARISGVTAVQPSTVGGGSDTGSTHRLAYTVTLSLTTKVLGGRFTPAGTTGTGGN